MEMPLHLSDLVPINVPLNQLSLFYVTGSAAREQLLPPDWGVNPNQIEQYSAYTYSQSNMAHGIIAYEKTAV